MKHQRATVFTLFLSCSVIRLYSLPTSLVFLLLLLTNASYFVSGSDEDDAGSDGYCQLCQHHTMCLFPFDDVGPNCIDVENGDLDPEEIRSIVHQHNVHRSNIAKGLETRGNPGPQPRGRNIMELTWDDELAKIARRWALQCNPFQKDKCRDVEHFQVWQNVNILRLEPANKDILEDPEEHRQPHVGIEKDVDASVTASPFLRIRFHVQSWLDEVERFDSARVGLVDFAIENETSYMAIAGAMITRVGCGRATYRGYLNETGDGIRVTVLPSKVTDNRNDSGISRLEVLVCNYGPIDRTTPRSLYDYGILEHCPEGSVPSTEYDRLCTTSEDADSVARGEMDDRIGEERTPGSGSHSIVDSLGWEGGDEERRESETSRSSAVSIALRKSTGPESCFHALVEILSLLVLLHIITKAPGSACC